MARAQSVWLVMQKEKPIAAFTVKRELANYLIEQAIENILVLKLKDGRPFNYVKLNGNWEWQPIEPKQIPLQDLL